MGNIHFYLFSSALCYGFSTRIILTILRSFAPPRHLKNLAPPIRTCLLRKIISAILSSLLAGNNGEASKAAVFRRLFTAMQSKSASWRRSLTHSNEVPAGKRRSCRADQRSMYFVDPSVLRLETLK